MIEDNYFSQDNLDTKPGEYRQTTVAVDSFSPNKWGIYNMHGNVSEWVWDYYGAYNLETEIDPTGADLFEIQLTNPYSDDYNTVLDETQHDQNIQARPEISNHVENMEQYDTVLIGYPNWWASIPMPVASFLEEYDFSGKTIIPFCSHGGGRFGQSLTAISKLAPNAIMGEGLSIHYSSGDEMPDDVAEWLKENKITQ